MRPLQNNTNALFVVIMITTSLLIATRGYKTPKAQDRYQGAASSSNGLIAPYSPNGQGVIGEK
jgi:hypothetical protein